MRWLEDVLTAAKPATSMIVGKSMASLARDVTDRTGTRSCLVLAPHPDDETLGCGATIMRKLDAGSAVHIAVVTDGATWPPQRSAQENIATRSAELHAATGILGVNPNSVSQLGLPETNLHQVEEQLLDAVSDMVAAHRPDEVFATSEADPHQDHAALASAVRRVLTGTGTRLLAYPIWQWERPRRWLRTWSGGGRPEVVRTDGYVSRKQRAIAVYRSQLSTQAGGEFEVGLKPWFVRRFVGRFEMFFPVDLSHGSAERMRNT
jgi:LmbE family N-acetylglucosaminyl deacetylase